MLRFLCAVLGFVAAVLGQTVAVQNHSSIFPFRGWHRATIGSKPPVVSGRWTSGERFVVGRSIAPSVWAVDVWLDLDPGQSKVLNFADAVPAPFALAPLPADLLGHFGGPVMLGDVPMQIREVWTDAASWRVKLHARTGPLFAVDLWIWWYPDQPGWAVGEVLVAASNVGVPDMSQTVDANLRIRFGDAIVYVPALGFDGQLAPVGQVFADGQAAAKPIGFGWLRHMLDPMAWASARVAADKAVSAVGVKSLWPDGTGQLPPGFNSAAWAQSQVAAGWSRLHTWDAPTCGPVKDSGQSGDQEDQVFHCGAEALRPGGGQAALVRLLAAYKMANRPCHWVEPDGRPVDPEQHPECVFWSGRPHYDRRVSPDQLGKPRQVGPADANGWGGADREHLLFGTVAAACQLFDSPACQWIMQQQCRNYLFGETTRPGLSTSGCGPARAIGWAGIFVVEAFQCVEDRGLVARVMQRHRERIDLVYVPQIGPSPGGIWDVRIDPRLNLPPGVPGWQAWQLSVGAYGLWASSRVVGSEVGRAMALKAARACVRENWVQLPGESRFRGVVNIRWTHVGKPPGAPYEPVPLSDYTDPSFSWSDSIRPQWYVNTWDVPAVHVVTAEDPDDAKAAAVKAQILAEVGATQSRSWYPPGF